MDHPAPGTDVDRAGIDENERLALATELSAALRGEVLFDAATRALYATDSSNYRQVPLGVVYPRDEADIVATLEVARRHHAPVLGRGAGTSLAGQACNVAVVLDTSRHMDAILEIDAAQRRARVQPGVVLDDLNAAARAIGLTFGPDPATHAWCTLGGMVGNNSCGTHALHYGKTVDNIERLRVVTYGGEVLDLGLTSDEEIAAGAGADTDRGRIMSEVERLRREDATLLATGYPDLDRRVSGYNLDQLLGEGGAHLARAVVGSESTLAMVSEITLTLSPWPAVRVLVVLAYEDVYRAADDVPRLLRHDLLGLEGFDGRLVDQMRRANLNVANLDLLPPGRGWLLCEVGADTLAEASARAAEIVGALPEAVHGVVLVDPAEQLRVWQVRESGLGATAHPEGEPVNYEGWEDAAVLPENLGTYLRGIRALWDEFGYDGAWYGHFGQGCVHTRNNFDLSSLEGLATYRAFVERAADLCVSLGGSISGEHGDGQSRGELLARMYSPEMLDAFRRFKTAWDPLGRMNPGKLIDPYPLDTNIRYGPAYRSANLLDGAFAFSRDGGSMQRAVERCVGVGKCRSEQAGVMCPSYRATHDERHSTRGRAKLLSEMFRGSVVEPSWRNEDVREALDLCLSCKGCVADCPTHVDMATYKSEFMSHYYRGRLRPRAAYALSLLPWAGRLASRVPGLANAVLQNSASAPLAMRAAGLTPRRRAPRFARRTLRASAEGARLRDVSAPSVVLWPDTFSDLFSPERVRASARVLELAGERVAIPEGWACCGRTLYDSGMLERAKATARATLDVLAPFVLAGTPIVVVEPSCLATFRDEIPELLHDDPRATTLATLVRSLAEHLEVTGWVPSRPLSDVAVSVHPHCHERATGRPQATLQVLTRAGADVEILDLGCCGLAGSFGYEAHHDDLSRQIAADRFLPGLADAATKGRQLVLDGFSCELQATHLSSLATTTLAQLLVEELDGPLRP